MKCRLSSIRRGEFRRQVAGRCKERVKDGEVERQFVDVLRSERRLEN